MLRSSYYFICIVSYAYENPALTTQYTHTHQCVHYYTCDMPIKRPGTCDSQVNRLCRTCRARCRPNTCPDIRAVVVVVEPIDGPVRTHFARILQWQICDMPTGMDNGYIKRSYTTFRVRCFVLCCQTSNAHRSLSAADANKLKRPNPIDAVLRMVMNKFIQQHNIRPNADIGCENRVHAKHIHWAPSPECVATAD